MNKIKERFQNWKGGKDFLQAQGQVAVILLIAYAGNNFPKAYPRNDNHNMVMFWIMNAVLLIAGIATFKHDANASARGVQLLSRPQTEEWKGWMQWAFIMVRLLYSVPSNHSCLHSFAYLLACPFISVSSRFSITTIVPTLFTT